MKLLLYQSPFPFPRSSFSLRPGNEHPSLARSLPHSFPPFVTCSLFLSSVHPLPSPPPPPHPTDLFALANVRTRSRVSRQVHKAKEQALPRRLLGYLRFLQRLRTEFSSSSSCLILALSVLQSLSVALHGIPPPGRQIKFLEERRKDHSPSFAPPSLWKPEPVASVLEETTTTTTPSHRLYQDTYLLCILSRPEVVFQLFFAVLLLSR